MKKHVAITVYGKVQGVYFRLSTKEHADRLGIKGFVKNQEDGSVYIEAEAALPLVDQFIAWCKIGPERAVVEKVEKQEFQLKNYVNFEIRK